MSSPDDDAATDDDTVPVADDADLFDPLSEDGPIEPTSRPVRFARNTAAGAVLNGVALGLQEVLEPVREEAPIIQVLPGEPPEPNWVDTDIDPLDPAASHVTVRHWLGDDAVAEASDDRRDDAG